MTYSEELKAFRATHTYETKIVEGSTFHYVLSGKKDVHISSLLDDLMNQKPVTADDFAQLKGNILLILPDQDFFSGEMQKNLIQLMHNPEIQYVSGEHLSTVLKVDAYVRTIRDFLSKHQGK